MKELSKVKIAKLYFDALFYSYILQELFFLIQVFY